MAFTKKQYNEIVEDVLAQITKGIVSERHAFDSKKLSYELSSAPVKDIVKVEGMLNGTHHTFKKDRDYRLKDNSIAWQDSEEKPDESAYFFVNYIFGDSRAKPSTCITDVNPGSVARTLVEAVSR